MLNALNILHWKYTTTVINFRPHFRRFFAKEDKILIKYLRQLKGYTATRFVREFRTKKLDKSTNSDNSEANCCTNLYSAKLNHILVYCVLIKLFESL